MDLTPSLQDASAHGGRASRRRPPSGGAAGAFRASNDGSRVEFIDDDYRNIAVLQLFQVLFARPGRNAIPWSRARLYR
jgi:hypothetical protein